jgi:hypothetical protein
MGFHAIMPRVALLPDALQDFLHGSGPVVGPALDRTGTSRRRDRKTVPTGGRSLSRAAVESGCERSVGSVALGSVSSCTRGAPEVGGDSRRGPHRAFAAPVLHPAGTIVPLVREGNGQRLWHVLSGLWERQPAGQPAVGDTLRRLRPKSGELQVPELSCPLLHALRHAVACGRGVRCGPRGWSVLPAARGSAAVDVGDSSSYARAAPARIAADSSRFGPYRPGAWPPASRHISVS